MFNSSTVTQAIESQLSGHASMSGVTDERSVRVNVFPGKMPWCGIYPGKVTTDPRVLAGPSCDRWHEVASPRILLQEQSIDEEGQEASDALDTLVANTLTAITSNLKFGLSGVRLVGIERDYTYVQMDTDEEGGLFFPQCEITLRLEIKS